MMKRHVFRTVLQLTVVFLSLAAAAEAQGPKGRSFGFGLQFGDPTAVTLRWWTSKANSWDAAVGVSHLGNPHVHAGYLWHFNDVFDSRVVSLYAGVGAMAGFGEKGDWVWSKGRKWNKDYWYYDDHEGMVLAARGIFGLNIIPRNTPLDIFFELDPILGVMPGFGFDIMGSLGLRFYP
jgi:hypothetical protein